MIDIDIHDIRDRITRAFDRPGPGLPGGRRSGTILVLVVAILTVLMLMAVTAAMTTRMGLFTGSYYADSARTEALVESVEKRVRHILHTDKYGTDGEPYDYDVGEAENELPATDPRSYPPRTAGDDLSNDDENFDSRLTEEWLPNPDPTVHEPWRRFNNSLSAATPNNAALVDNNDDGTVDDSDTPYAVWQSMDSIYGSMLGGGVHARYALFFIDMGGARADLNAMGNASGDRNQGLGPYEAELGELIDELGGDTPDEQAIAEWRNGPDGAPGNENDSDGVDFLGDDLDKDGDGTVDGGAVTDKPSEFISENPLGDDTPFDAFSMHDLLWGRNRGSAAAQLLAQTGNVAPEDLSYFTTASYTTIVAGASVLNDDAWDYTTPGNLRGDAFLNNVPGGDLPIGPTTRDDGDNPVELPLKRALWSDNPGELHNTNSGDVAGELANLIQNLGGPVGHVDTNTGPIDSASDELAGQIAHNLVDLVDEGHEMTRDTGNGYYGVERQPFIAEVEASIDTLTGTTFVETSGFVPDPDRDDEGNLPATLGNRPRWGDTFFADEDNGGGGNGVYDQGEAVWVENDGTAGYDPGDGDVPVANVPPPLNAVAAINLNSDPETGWGKYIKLVNPWPTEVDLADYTIELTNLRRWDFDEANGEWETDTVGDTVTIDLSGNIPARGHVIIVDNPNPGGDYATAFGNIDVDNSITERQINGMQEGEGPQDMTPTELTLLKNGNTVMEFRLNDGPGGTSLTEEDDSDNPAADDDNENQDSVQVGDPRPCRVRAGSAVTDNAYLWQAQEAEATWSSWPAGAGDCAELGWFNETWRGTDTVGDGWGLLNDADDGSTPNMGQPNILHSFVPAAVTDSATYTGTGGQETQIRNIGTFPTVGALGYVHGGVPWTSVSLAEPPSQGDFNEESLVYLPGLIDYLVAPNSPYEDAFDQDGDGEQDDQGDPNLDGELAGGGLDRNGAEIRRHGRVNVNTAPQEVIKTVLKRSITSDSNADDIAAEIVDERDPTEGDTAGPYTSISDLFNRVPEIFERGTPDIASPANTFAAEARARFMSNLVTVRTDVWGVVARVQMFDDWQDDPNNGNPGEYDPLYDTVPQDAIVAERRFYFVLDRSVEPMRVIMKRYLPD